MLAEEFAKARGQAIVGAGLLAMALSLGYVGHGVFSRFDEMKSLADRAEATTVLVNDTVKNVRTLEADIKQDLTTLRAQFPQLGTESGQSAAKAVTAFKKALSCDESPQNCNKDDIRAIKNGILKKLTQ